MTTYTTPDAWTVELGSIRAEVADALRDGWLDLDDADACERIAHESAESRTIYHGANLTLIACPACPDMTDVIDSEFCDVDGTWARIDLWAFLAVRDAITRELDAARAERDERAEFFRAHREQAAAGVSA